MAGVDTRFFRYAMTSHRKRVRPLGPPPIAWLSTQGPGSQGQAYGTVLRLVIRDHGGCQHVLKAAPAPSNSHTAATAVVVRQSRRRVLKVMRALPLQDLHLTYKAGPFVTYGVPVWASGRPSRMVHYVERPRRKVQTVDLENVCLEGLSNPLSPPRRGLLLCTLQHEIHTSHSGELERRVMQDLTN